MLTGLVLLYVGAVLFLNGLWLFGRIADREIVLINLVVATISAIAAGNAALTASGIADVRAGALTLLFATTYLWVAYNRMTECDGRGLGWFSLFVALTVLPVAAHDVSHAQGMLELWLGLSWAIWAALWFLYFLFLTLQRPIQPLTAWVTLLSGNFTGWLPGMLLLFGAGG